MTNQVKAWKEQVTIPSYEVGKPEKNPMFLEKRVYQGSSGVVYPHPIIEKISDRKTDKTWNAIYLENRYLKIMLLPELGGRVQMAYDKIKQRHFVYYNQVIKPALVGLTGPWISGGIEFNWPQHHRPSTFEPVDALIEENEDGSVTVWCSEVERMFRTKGMAGFTLYPDKAYLEIKVKLYNRTPFPQTFLWWANPAVKVNDDYQSVFPPDVHAVFDHGKRDVSSFPIATGTYYKIDYSSGVDISKYKNIPVPTSYMAVASKYDFVGGYENDSKGGLLHVADHHVSPGKKQWTWGNGEFGRAWDRNLTDEDGPYIELMCGVFTDNQPDFSWLQPYEEKSFSQYFMPYRDLGMVKNATKDAMVNLEISNGTAIVKVYATSEYQNATIRLSAGTKVLHEKKVDLSPEQSLEFTVPLPDGASMDFLCFLAEDCDGNVLVEYKPTTTEPKPIPEPAKAAKKPSDTSSTEQLFLTGLHLEQYRHATYNPTDYYLEALRREPGDVRNNNAMGLWLMRRGKFAAGEAHFRKAIATLTERNPNPYDGEPYYNLGLCLQWQDRLEEAFDAFMKSTWNAAWQDSGFFHAAQILAEKHDYQKAIDLADKSLNRNWTNQKYRHLKAILLRKAGRQREAENLIDESLKMDQFSFGLLYERYLLLKESNILRHLTELMRGYVHNFIEYSLDYATAGFYQEAVDFISIYLDIQAASYPTAMYLKGHYQYKNHQISEAKSTFQTAAKLSSDYCFPNRLEELLTLETATKIYPGDAKAWYYMGNFWYGARQHKEAQSCWERSREADSSFATVHRNLALAYFNKQHDAAAAQKSLEKAFDLDQSDARILMELDLLYKKTGMPIHGRLGLLDKYPELVNERDDLYLERITLLNLCGKEEKALELLMHRQFHPWEGGEGKVTGQYLFCHVELAKKAIKSHEFNKAISHLEATLTYPHNLGEGKLDGTQENDIHYWLGCAYEELGEMQKARSSWEKASIGSSTPSVAMYYNDQPPDKIFYQGMALIKLGKTEEAQQKFEGLVEYGKHQISIPFQMDYFAVSLPDLLIFEEDLQQRHEINCHYLMGLGLLGMEKKDEACAKFYKVLGMNPYHIGGFIHNQMC